MTKLRHMANISTGEAATRLGVSIRTIHRLVRDGELAPAVKFPGKTGGFMFDEDEVGRCAAERAA